MSACVYLSAFSFLSLPKKVMVDEPSATLALSLFILLFLRTHVRSIRVRARFAGDAMARNVPSGCVLLLPLTFMAQLARQASYLVQLLHI
jgi:hypothetical protein